MPILSVNDLALLLIVVYYLTIVGVIGWVAMWSLERLSAWSERWHERSLRKMPERITRANTRPGY
jgi:hypothetical protein